MRRFKREQRAKLDNSVESLRNQQTEQYRTLTKSNSRVESSVGDLKDALSILEANLPTDAERYRISMAISNAFQLTRLDTSIRNRVKAHDESLDHKLDLASI